jgi:hypothetical protein
MATRTEESSAAARWLRRAYEEARRAQEDPRRNAAFMEWKREHEARTRGARGKGADPYTREKSRG